MAEVWINEQRIATHRGGWIAFDVDVPPQIAPGQTFDLRLEVSSRSHPLMSDAGRPLWPVGDLHVAKGPLPPADNNSSGIVDDVELRAYGSVAVADAFTGWKRSGDNLWSATVPGVASGAHPYFRQLWVGNERRYRARTPGVGANLFRVTQRPLTTSTNFGTQNGPEDRFVFAPGQLKQTWTNIADIEVVLLHFWVDTHLPVAAISEAERLVTFAKKSRLRFTDDYSQRGARFYVENVREALDEPGEWYLDRNGVLTYFPRPGEDMTKVEVIAPRLTELVRFEGDPAAGRLGQHIALRSLTFAHNAWSPPRGESQVPRQQAANFVPGALRARGARFLTIENCRIAHYGSYGVEIGEGCSQIRVAGCTFVDGAAGGVKINGGDAESALWQRTGANVIADNHIHHPALLLLLCALPTLARQQTKPSRPNIIFILAGRKRSLYEGGIRVPFIVGAPGLTPAGRVDDSSVLAGVNWLPTVCALAGVPLPPGLQMDGEDRSSVLRGQGGPRTKPLLWEWRFRVFGPVSSQSPQLALRDGKWKLLMNPDRARVELYDLVADPSETNNVAHQNPSVVAALSERLLAWGRSLPPGPRDAQAGRNDYYPWPRDGKKERTKK